MHGAMSMTAETTESGASVPPYVVAEPARQTVPLVFASPHSGRHYPEDFVAGARLDPLSLRGSEDAFVDEIFAAVPEHGAPLLTATFPRAYVDPNREPYELDPEMFGEELPDWVNTTSPRVRGGLGTIARVVTNGAEIYREKLSFAEARHRIAAYYEPYHEALSQLIDRTRARFGACILVDCHSMPSIGGPMDEDSGRRRVDFIIGDRYGASCAAAISDLTVETLRGLDYHVARNAPYAGGFTTAHYGRPREGVHAIQIEINRRLYMDEASVSRSAGLSTVAAHMESVVAQLSAVALSELSK